MENQEPHVHAEIEINTPREKVWEVLTDFEKMSEWSSSFQRLEGEFKEGGKATSYYKGPMGEMSFDHTIIEFKEGESFGWSDPVMLGMKDHHTFRLESLPNGNTRFIQTDGVQGGVSWLMGKMLEKNMAKGYETFNQELRERVESMNN